MLNDEHLHQLLKVEMEVRENNMCYHFVQGGSYLTEKCQARLDWEKMCKKEIKSISEINVNGIFKDRKPNFIFQCSLYNETKKV